MWILTNKSELEKGIKVEREHESTIKSLLQKLGIKPDEQIIQQTIESIAKDHLNELSDYYSRLELMERGE